MKISFFPVNENGLALLEAVIAVSIMVVLCSLALPAQKILQEATLTYEANVLAQNIRKLERHGHLLERYDEDFPEHTDGTDRWQLRLLGNSYEIRCNNATIMKHTFSKGIWAHWSTIEFYESGIATNDTIMVFYNDAVPSKYRFVVVDLMGRVRVSRNSP